MKERKEHERMIEELIEGFLHSDSHPMIEFGNTLTVWKEEILNSFISYKGNRLSNGKIENKNKYVKKIKDIANGYSNFRRFRNRIMYSENPFEKPSEERIEKQIKRKMPKRGPYKKAPVDIEDVQIDTRQSKAARIRSFISQVKDPYQIMIDGVLVEMEYSDNGYSLQEAVVMVIGIDQ